MHQKHLLRFIKSKLRKEPDEVVIFRDGKYLTLREVFESLHMTGCAAAQLATVIATPAAPEQVNPGSSGLSSSRTHQVPQNCCARRSACKWVLAGT